jgi:hypothetical protein
MSVKIRFSKGDVIIDWKDIEERYICCDPNGDFNTSNEAPFYSHEEQEWLNRDNHWGNTFQQIIPYKPEEMVWKNPNMKDDKAPKFRLGDRVRKIKGSEWQGRVVGTYSTEFTPEGYCVESESHKHSVQIYPAAALELV